MNEGYMDLRYSRIFREVIWMDWGVGRMINECVKKEIGAINQEVKGWTDEVTNGQKIIEGNMLIGNGKGRMKKGWNWEI